jgi:hypothetical protein
MVEYAPEPEALPKPQSTPSVGPTVFNAAAPPEPQIDPEEVATTGLNSFDELMQNRLFAERPKDWQAKAMTAWHQQKDAELDSLHDQNVPAPVISHIRSLYQQQHDTAQQMIANGDRPMTAAEQEAAMDESHPDIKDLTPDKKPVAKQWYDAYTAALHSDAFKKGAPVAAQSGLPGDVTGKTGWLNKSANEIETELRKYANKNVSSASVTADRWTTSAASLATSLLGRNVQNIFSKLTTANYDPSDPKQAAYVAAIRDYWAQQIQEQHPYAAMTGDLVGAVSGFGGLAKVVGSTVKGVRYVSVASKAAQTLKAAKRLKNLEAVLTTTTAAANIASAKHGTTFSPLEKGYLKDMAIESAKLALMHVVGKATGNLVGKRLMPMLAPKLKYNPYVATAGGALGAGAANFASMRAVEVADAMLHGHKSFTDQLKDDMLGPMDYKTGKRTGAPLGKFGMDIGLGAAIGGIGAYKNAKTYLDTMEARRLALASWRMRRDNGTIGDAALNEATQRVDDVFTKGMKPKERESFLDDADMYAEFRDEAVKAEPHIAAAEASYQAAEASKEAAQQARDDGFVQTAEQHDIGAELHEQTGDAHAETAQAEIITAVSAAIKRLETKIKQKAEKKAAEPESKKPDEAKTESVQALPKTDSAVPESKVAKPLETPSPQPPAPVEAPLPERTPEPIAATKAQATEAPVEAAGTASATDALPKPTESVAAPTPAQEAVQPSKIIPSASVEVTLRKGSNKAHKATVLDVQGDSVQVKFDKSVSFKGGETQSVPLGNVMLPKAARTRALNEQQFEGMKPEDRKRIKKDATEFKKLVTAHPELGFYLPHSLGMEGTAAEIAQKQHRRLAIEDAMKALGGDPATLHADDSIAQSELLPKLRNMVDKSKSEMAKQQAHDEAVAAMEPDTLGEEFLLDPEDAWPSLDTPEKANDYILVHDAAKPVETAKLPLRETGAASSEQRADTQGQADASEVAATGGEVAPTTYINGDKAEYTGETREIAGGTFHVVKFLEGLRAGKEGVTQRGPDGVSPNDARAKAEWQRQQEDARKIAAAQKAEAGGFKTQDDTAFAGKTPQELLALAAPYTQYGPDYNRNIATSVDRLRQSVERGDKFTQLNADELAVRLEKWGTPEMSIGDAKKTPEQLEAERVADEAAKAELQKEQDFRLAQSRRLLAKDDIRPEVDMFAPPDPQADIFDKPGAIDAAIARLQAAKKKPTDTLQISIFPGLDPASFRAIWNTGIDIAIGVLKATRSVARAIAAALEHFRSTGHQMDETAAKEALESHLLPSAATPQDRPMPSNSNEPSPGRLRPLSSRETGAVVNPLKGVREPRVTATKNEIVDEERVARGLPPMMTALRQSHPEVWDAAMMELERNPMAGEKLVAEINGKPRTVTATEEAIMLRHKIDVQNAFYREMDVVNDPESSPQAKASAQLESAVLLDRMNDIDNATKAAGTEWGRLGVFRQQLAREDYTLVDMLNKRRAALGGEPLTQAETDYVTKLNERIVKLEQQHEQDLRNREVELERVKNEAIDEAIKRMKAEQERTDPMAQSIYQRIKKGLHSEAEKARERIRERLGKASAGIDPTVLYDVSIIGADKLLTVGENFVKWSAAMLEDLGDFIKPHLDEAFEKSKKFLDDTVDANVPKPDRPKVKRTAKKDQTVEEKKQDVLDSLKRKADTPEAIGGYIQKLAKLFVAQGITEREALVTAVHDAVKPILPESTNREIRDAISGYGDYHELSKDEISVKLRDLKGQLQQVSKLDDMLKEGKLPSKTGVERREPSADERTLIKEVNRVKKELGLEATDENQLKSARDAIKSRLRNELEELQRALETKQRIPSNKRTLEDDAETAQLRRDVRAKRKEYTDMLGIDTAAIEGAKEDALKKSIAALEQQIATGELEPSPGTPTADTAEVSALKSRRDALLKQKAAIRKPGIESDALDQRIDALEKKIAAGDLSAKVSAKRTDTPENAEKRAKLAELNKQLADMRKAAKPKLTPDQVALKIWKSRAEKRLADLLDRTARSDFSKKPRKTVTLDAAANATKAKIEAAKLEFDRANHKAQQANRTGWEKLLDIIPKASRFNLLTSPVTLAKLTAAAAWRAVFTPIEDLVGAGLSKIPGLDAIAAASPRHSGFNTSAQIAAITKGITKGGKDAWDLLTKGESEFEVLSGKRRIEDHDWWEIPGRIHGALKSTTKRGEYERALQMRIEFAANHGVDVTDPNVLTKLQVDSYKDAQRAIFMHDNALVSRYQRFVRSLGEPDKITGKVNRGMKLLQTALKTTFPIVKIPTNIVAEAFDYIAGHLVGGFKVRRAFKEGISNLKPEEADTIMRQLKKGSVGSALLLAGYLLPQFIGGYYQRGKKQDDDLKAGDVKAGDSTVSHTLLHNPAIEMLQVGATVRKVAESKARKADSETQGMGAGIYASAVGLADQIPFIKEMTNISTAMSPNDRHKYWGELARSRIEPALLQWIAKQIDKDENSEPVKRQTETLTEYLKSGIPGLRNTLDEKRSRRGR